MVIPTVVFLIFGSAERQPHDFGNMSPSRSQEVKDFSLEERIHPPLPVTDDVHPA